MTITEQDFDAWFSHNEPDADEVLEMIRKSKNAYTFAAVYDEGDLSEFSGNYRKAVRWLIYKLAFWTAKNARLMNHLFRQSALYHQKWDERRPDGKTFGESYIEEVIRRQKDTFDW